MSFQLHTLIYPADVKKVLVVLTDGYGGMVSGPAQRLHNAGVVIFSVGIGSSVSLQDLHNMASHPKEKHVVVLNSFSQLSALSQQMSSKTCNGECNDMPLFHNSLTLRPYSKILLSDWSFSRWSVHTIDILYTLDCASSSVFHNSVHFLRILKLWGKNCKRARFICPPSTIVCEHGRHEPSAVACWQGRGQGATAPQLKIF